MKEIIIVVSICIFGIVMWCVGYWAGAVRRVREDVFRGD